MPEKRQARGEDPILVRSLGLAFPSGAAIENHAHPWHQLIYACDGVMTVTAPSGTWVTPPHRAVWIEAHFDHDIRMVGRVRMKTLYFHPELAVDLPGPCCVIGVAPLLRELVLTAVATGMLRRDDPRQERLARVIVDQLVPQRVSPLEIVLPRDERARRVAERARRDVGGTASLPELARGSGASPRTVERLFRSETGLTFGRWRQRIKALHALERLAEGDSVARAGASVGFSSTSAFIEMFRRITGVTPGSFFARLDGDDAP
ncbi:MAG: helix-turn-helix transcriptional regulator [Planctomycetota bacterium]